MKDFWGYSLDTPWFFTNFSFLGILGVFLMIYALLIDNPLIKKIFLILFSLYFYYKSSGPYLIIFILMIVIDFNVALLIEKIQKIILKKLLLVISIALSLSFLLYFKYSGFFRIISGLAKKLLIADYLAKYVDIVHSNPQNFSGLENLIAMYVYSFQIYFDFSGYSDIAIGIALILGYKLKENFDHPYLSENISSFWRKWHISLSSWLRDYIYISLGGNRKGAVKTYLFLLTTMIIGGFWHGAKWTFIIWGILHGIGLVLHKILNRYNLIKFLSNKYLNIFLTFNYISFLWIFFRAVDTKNAIISINKILFETNLKEIPAFYLARKETILFLLISTVIIFSKNLYKNRINLIFHKMPIWMIGFLMIAFLQIILQLKDNLVEPFIYFQF